MTELTLEWVKKAEEDFSAIEQLFFYGKKPLYSIVCFHAQQCVEKYLKAYLTEINIEFEKTHRLTPLLDLCLPTQPGWDLQRDALKVLTGFAVLFRYPFEVQVDRKDAQNAVEITQEIRTMIRAELDIKESEA
jgi:HEPN domain-containing protein